MASRRRKLMLNISTNISNAGSVMPHTAVGILKKKRKKSAAPMYQEGKTPMIMDNPYPHESVY